MSDAGEYGVHQHASPDAVRAHTFVGEPAGLATVNQSVVGASPATFSTAPYKKPQPPPKSELCARENCNGWAMKNSDYCRWHKDDPPAAP